MVGEKIGDFRDLEVWQKCQLLRKKIFDLCKAFPQSEKYSLSSQLIRASRSATACIAEGYGRYHYQENIQFCRQARGSLFELIDHILVAEECEYIPKVEKDTTIEQIKKCIMVLNGYIRYLQQRKQTGSK